MKKSLVRCHHAFLIVGFSALAYCAITVSQTVRFQTWAYRQMLTGKAGSPTGPAPGQVSASASLGLQAASPGEMSLVGRLEIPSIHVSAVIAEGDSARVLQRAVGHVPHTALPGQSGNVVLAGHRDTFFRRLGGLKKDDRITLETARGEYFYRVQFTQVVDPGETWVLNSSGGEMLTLITCYPFYFIGSAPKRFIVRASRLATPGM